MRQFFRRIKQQLMGLPVPKVIPGIAQIHFAEGLRRRQCFALQTVEGVVRVPYAPQRPKLRICMAGKESSIKEANLVFEADNAPRLAGASEWYRAVFSFVLNTHMMPNGDHTLTALMYDGSTVIAEGALTLTIANEGTLARRTRAALEKHGTPWMFQGPIDSRHFPYEDTSIQSWTDQPDAIKRVPRMAAKYALNDDETAELRRFIEEGYAILPEPVETAHIDAINADIDNALKKGDVASNNNKDPRIEQMHTHSKAVEQLWVHPPVMRFLDCVFDDTAMPCQTLTFVQGSEQKVHQDTIHLTPFPAGHMCGAWVALEDVDEDAGPLVIYPGSHKLSRLYGRKVGMGKVKDGNWDEYAEKFLPALQKEVEKADLPAVYYTPKKGQILIWHENLAHGGSERKNARLSRRSIVSHYFAKGGIAYYDSTGMPGAMAEVPRIKQPRKLINNEEHNKVAA